MSSNFIYHRFGFIVLIMFLLGVAAANSQQTEPIKVGVGLEKKFPVFNIPCSELGSCDNQKLIVIPAQK